MQMIGLVQEMAKCIYDACISPDPFHLVLSFFQTPSPSFWLGAKIVPKYSLSLLEMQD